jgi:hypothetical protein
VLVADRTGEGTSLPVPEGDSDSEDVKLLVGDTLGDRDKVAVGVVVWLGDDVMLGEVLREGTLTVTEGDQLGVRDQLGVAVVDRELDGDPEGLFVPLTEPATGPREGVWEGRRHKGRGGEEQQGDRPWAARCDGGVHWVQNSENVRA